MISSSGGKAIFGSIILNSGGKASIRMQCVSKLRSEKKGDFKGREFRLDSLVLTGEMLVCGAEDFAPIKSPFGIRRFAHKL
jgi:hypothetical protein